ncbi:hypothetical protein GOB93_14120 [Acetobacter musti]|uniref:Uncharacterized protein n=1 Tax=Acetobacter musti TaxID=864732 RepID=A0ABX0JRF5_9PROT|nr:hypothetical protein [Acetobacter musti]NHN85769.1 hypothetical protein [Acetobacter musti]
MTNPIKTPAGYFVQLPLTEERRQAHYNGGEILPIEDAIRAIGTPVADDVPVVTTLGTVRDPVPCVRQSDHLAALVKARAENERLRGALVNLVKSAERVNSRGAVTGNQWVSFPFNISRAKYVLNAEPTP